MLLEWVNSSGSSLLISEYPVTVASILSLKSGHKVK
jgi:hypothetical protein